MRTNDRLVKSATRLISNIGPAVPNRSVTFDTVPTTMSGGARLNEPPEVTIGAPGRMVPKRCALSINRTIGTLDGPRPSRIPVSRTGNAPFDGTVSVGVNEGTLTVTFTVVSGMVVVPGVNPGMFDVTSGFGIVVVVVVVLDVDADASGSLIGEVASGLLMTFTDNAYSGSVINITIERRGNTLVILPTRPAAFITGMPTFTPLSLPWFISTLCE